MSSRPLSVLELGMAWFTEQPGGLDRFYAGLIENAEPAGLRVRGLVTGSPNVAIESGGRVTAFARADESLLSRWRAARRAVAAMQQELPLDLWVSHFALYAFPVMRMLRDLPHVVHFQGPWADESRREGDSTVSVKLKMLLEQRVYRSAAKLIVLSEAFRWILCERYGIDQQRVCVIPGAVNIERFRNGPSRQEAREQLGLPSGRPILCCVRRLVRRMGLPQLIDAVGLLRQRHPEVLCVIGGRGPLHQELQERIQAAGLLNHVRLIGFVPDAELPVLYRAADLSVVPTEAWEGFGLVVVESLAAGTPAVVTPVGGLPEIVGPFSPDLVTRDGTPAAIAGVLALWLSDGIKLPSAAACQTYAVEHYSWPLIAGRVAHVYRGVV